MLPPRILLFAIRFQPCSRCCFRSCGMHGRRRSRCGWGPRPTRLRAASPVSRAGQPGMGGVALMASDHPWEINYRHYAHMHATATRRWLHAKCPPPAELLLHMHCLAWAASQPLPPMPPLPAGRSHCGPLSACPPLLRVLQPRARATAPSASTISLPLAGRCMLTWRSQTLGVASLIQTTLGWQQRWK